MVRRPGRPVDVLPGNLIVAAAILVVLPIIGTAGYMLLEGWSFLDSLYDVHYAHDGRFPGKCGSWTIRDACSRCS